MNCNLPETMENTLTMPIQMDECHEANELIGGPKHGGTHKKVNDNGAL